MVIAVAPDALHAELGSGAHPSGRFSPPIAMPDLSALTDPAAVREVLEEFVGVGVDDDGSLVARGGKIREVRPWWAGDHELQPITYECVLNA